MLALKKHFITRVFVETKNIKVFVETKNIFGCFFCFDLLWSWTESAVSPAEKKCYFGFDSGKKCEI